MKIQHIRRNKKIIGTIVAVKDESKGIVNVGFSLVMNGDNPTKKIGVTIALDRALNGTSGLAVPKKIEPEFREFLNHISTRSEFQGFHTPLADDFSYTYDPIRWVGYGVHSEY